MEGEPPYLQGAVTIEVCERRGIKEFWADRPKDLGLAPSLCMGAICSWQTSIQELCVDQTRDWGKGNGWLERNQALQLKRRFGT